MLESAFAQRAPLDIAAGGTKRGFGHAVAARRRLDLRALSGIVDYDPAELVLTCRAATPLAEIGELLRDNGQHLAFEPPDLSLLLDGPAAGATLGGVLAANLSGPRRLRAGAARDHALGVEAVTGRAEVVRAGGRVVKNVSGYDMTKLMCGSWGTLAVMTEISVKVLPLPEKVRTVLVAGLAPERACGAMNAALSSPHEVTAAAHLPAAAAARSSVGHVAQSGASITALRLEGPPVSVTARHEATKALLAPHGELAELHGRNSAALWREVRDAAPLLAPLSGNDSAVWKLSVPPGSGGGVLARLAASGIDAYLDWGGGLVWCVAPGDPAASAAVRDEAERSGGHATLVRASAELKASVAVFHPQPAARASLTRRIKAGFDPAAILNPGRMGPDL